MDGVQRVDEGADDRVVHTRGYRYVALSHTGGYRFSQMLDDLRTYVIDTFSMATVRVADPEKEIRSVPDGHGLLTIQEFIPAVELRPQSFLQTLSLFAAPLAEHSVGHKG